MQNTVDVHIGAPCTGQVLQPGVIQRPCKLASAAIHLAPVPPRVLQDVLRLLHTACIEHAYYICLLGSRCTHYTIAGNGTWASLGGHPHRPLECSLLRGRDDELRVPRRWPAGR
jgi:hypothetical protein